jgi:MtN3 and saliva related transmembrane protein
MDALGYIAALFATGSFVPQVIKTMLLTHVIGMLLWLTYGVMIGAAPVVVANTIAVLLDAILIGLKLRTAAGAAQ